MTDIPDFDIRMSDDVRSAVAMQNFDAMLSDHMRVFQAQREEQIRAQLIELGWTPPGGMPVTIIVWCPHVSESGAEGPVVLLGRLPILWECDTCHRVRVEVTG